MEGNWRFENHSFSSKFACRPMLIFFVFYSGCGAKNIPFVWGCPITRELFFRQEIVQPEKTSLRQELMKTTKSSSICFLAPIAIKVCGFLVFWRHPGRRLKDPIPLHSPAEWQSSLSRARERCPWTLLNSRIVCRRKEKMRYPIVLIKIRYFFDNEWLSIIVDLQTSDLNLDRRFWGRSFFPLMEISNFHFWSTYYI